MNRWHVARMMVLLLLNAGSVSAFCQQLADPTVPPMRGKGAPPDAGQSEGSALVLQSILMHARQRSAIISGEHVRLGQKIAGMRVVRIDDSEVTLLSGGERRVLKLFPAVEKRVIRTPVLSQSSQ